MDRTDCRFFHMLVGTEAFKIMSSGKQGGCLLHFRQVQRLLYAVQVLSFEDVCDSAAVDAVFVPLALGAQTGMKPVGSFVHGKYADVLREITVEIVQDLLAGAAA